MRRCQMNRVKRPPDYMTTRRRGECSSGELVATAIPSALFAFICVHLRYILSVTSTPCNRLAQSFIISAQRYWHVADACVSHAKQVTKIRARGGLCSPCQRQHWRHGSQCWLRPSQLRRETLFKPTPPAPGASPRALRLIFLRDKSAGDERHLPGLFGKMFVHGPGTSHHWVCRCSLYRSLRKLRRHCQSLHDGQAPLAGLGAVGCVHL